MVLLSNPLPPSLDRLSLYSAHDVQLNCPVLVFYGPSALTNNTVSATRIQVHVFSPAGLRSYSRLTISPESPHYAAVGHLPYELQGDEVSRGLALSLLRYFSEVPKIVRAHLSRYGGPKMFDEMHAGELASRMGLCDQKEEVLRKLQAAFVPKHISHLDLDLVLPTGTLSSPHHPGTVAPEYADFLELIGQSEFLPTSRIKRAPSNVHSVNRSKLLLQKNQDIINQEIDQMIQTEGNYVSKLSNLLQGLVRDMRRQTIVPVDQMHLVDYNELDQLFPSSLDAILESNCKFLDGLHRLQRTDLVDPCGVMGLSALMSEAVVQFQIPYRDYLRANRNLANVLQRLRSAPLSPTMSAITSYGEQRLKTVLIEPVQRLPRYTMYLDNIMKELYREHPALNKLLRTKDSLVDICALDATVGTPADSAVLHLQGMTRGWPSQFAPQGRLIAAIDASELPSLHDVQCDTYCASFIILLFRDVLVMLNKHSATDATAHGLMTELDRLSSGSGARPTVTADVSSQEPLFAGWIPLDEIRVRESADGRIAYVTLLSEMRDMRMHFGRSAQPNMNGPGTRALLLEGPYEGRANRLSEDLMKARLEGRYTEEEREGATWDLRRLNVAASDVDLWAAASEEISPKSGQKKGQPALVRVVLDGSETARSVPVGSQGIEVIVHITRQKINRFKVRIESLGSICVEDESDTDNVLATMLMRLSPILLHNSQINNPILSLAAVSDNTQILRSLLKSKPQASPSKSRTIRAPSPVKLLSNMLGSALGSHHMSPTKDSARHTRSPTKNIPRMLPTRTLPERPIPTNRPPAELIENVDQSVSVIGLNAGLPRSESFARLEETMRTFAIAISDRAEEVTGIAIRGRRLVDEAVVNAIYNTSVDSMANQQNMWEVPIAVLFAALEKFLKHAWTEQMGPVVSSAFLDLLHANQDIGGYGGDFEENFRACRENLTPQNSRAFEALMKLLAVLLQSSTNDGDRGSLTLAFAEMLVTDADPYQYVGLLDRLVEDAVSLFAEPSTMSTNTPFTASLASSIASRSTYATTGSINSKASSFRSRFASILGKESSSRSGDQEPRSGGVFRALSKHKPSSSSVSGMSTPASLSKISLGRSKSSDANSSLAGFFGRPNSKDQGSILEEPESTSSITTCPPSSHMLPSRPPSVQSRVDALSKSPGGMGLMAPPPIRTKVKRRSSLSDLANLQRPSSSSSASPAPASPLIAHLSLKDPGSPFNFSASKPCTPIRTLTRPLPLTPSPLRPSSHHGASSSPFNSSFQPLNPKRPSSSDSPKRPVAPLQENQPRTPVQLKAIPRLTPGNKTSPSGPQLQASPLGERCLNRMSEGEIKRNSSSSKENPPFSDATGTVTSPSGIPTPRSSRLGTLRGPPASSMRTKGSLKIPAAFSAAATEPKLGELARGLSFQRPIGNIMDRQRPLRTGENDLTITLGRLQLQRPERSPTKPGSPTKIGSHPSRSLLPSWQPSLVPSEPKLRPSGTEGLEGGVLPDPEPASAPVKELVTEQVAPGLSSQEVRSTPSHSPPSPSKPANPLSSPVRAAVTGTICSPRKITPPIASLTAKEKDARIIAAETRLRSVEKHLKECQTENLLLYDRFNTELEKLVRGCVPNAGSDSNQDMSLIWTSQIKGLGDELGKVRKENVKLKRENVSLRGKVAACEKTHSGSN